MIVGLGIDLVEIERIRNSLDRFGDRLLQKVLCPEEIERLSSDPAHQVAALFAGKEAAVKALGTGFRLGVTMHDIRILHLPSGKPEIHFSGRALEVSRELGAERAHISLTHERGNAAAVVILEK